MATEFGDFPLKSNQVPTRCDLCGQVEPGGNWIKVVSVPRFGDVSGVDVCEGCYLWRPVLLAELDDPGMRELRPPRLAELLGAAEHWYATSPAEEVPEKS